jgi:hypothetical protein
LRVFYSYMVVPKFCHQAGLIRKEQKRKRVAKTLERAAAALPKRQICMPTK